VKNAQVYGQEAHEEERLIRKPGKEKDKIT
jgi:hypothetical protein